MLRTLELQLQWQVIFDSIEFVVRRSQGLLPTPKGSLWERDALGIGGCLSKGILRIGIGDSLGDAAQI